MNQTVQEKITEANKNEVLAVDFGTVNTYLSKCPADKCLPSGIDFTANKTGLASAILERKEKKPIIGDIAIEEFCEATTRERKDYQLFTQFKPDIFRSEQARKISKEFLSSILRDAEKIKLDISPLKRNVIFGVPCFPDEKTKSDYYKALKEITAESGFGSIKPVDESVGALIYHVAVGNLSSIDAQKGVLVIDFGGGTCDFSLMMNGTTYRSWGDNKLGGRLFDDLFLQWFLDTNPKMLNQLKKDNRELFTLLVDCKNIKERFSEMVSRDKETVIHKTIGNYGHIENMSVNEFEKRAESYRLSEIFDSYFNRIGIIPDEKLYTSVNLIKWFEAALLSGFKTDQHFSLSDIEYVILAGGSSLWYFVSDITKQYFPAARIIRSDRPYATVAEGLSMIPALKKKNELVRKQLQEELPSFCSASRKSDNLRSSIENCINNHLKSIVDEITFSIFINKVIPVIHKFRSTGGKIIELKEHIQAIPDLSSDIHNIIDSSITNLGNDLEILIHSKLSDWFKSHNICISDTPIVSEKINFNIDNSIISNIDSINTLINNLLGGIAGIVIAFIFSNPVSIILGFVGAFFIILFGTNLIDKLINKNVYLSPAFARLIFNDKKIKKITKDFSKNLTSELNKKTSKFMDHAMSDIKKYIQSEINALNDFQTI